jgi:hypothetical protein
MGTINRGIWISMVWAQAGEIDYSVRVQYVYRV